MKLLLKRWLVVVETFISEKLNYGSHQRVNSLSYGARIPSRE